MNLLNKLTIKNLRLNKKRTIVTIIGIILSVALITAVASVYVSGISSLIDYETYEKGNFHYSFFNVPYDDIPNFTNNRKIEKIYLTKNIGYAKLEESKNRDKPYANIMYFSKDAIENLSIKLIDGKLPESEDEIVIPEHLKTNGRIFSKIGDTITLNVGTRVSKGNELYQYNPLNDDVPEDIINTVTKTYKIVGIIERPSSYIESYSAPGYTFITYMNDESISGNVNLYVRYTKDGLNERYKVTANILGVNPELYDKIQRGKIQIAEEIDEYKRQISQAKYKLDENSYLIGLEINPLSMNHSTELGTVALIVCGIIVFTSVFCIKNSFDISITEKTKQYGMLRSIGATKKQIKKNVFYEAFILGLIGIPLGILLGFLASYILIIISNLLLSRFLIEEGINLHFAFSWFSVLFAIILGIITIYLSARKSARKATKISPIDSIRNNWSIRIKKNKLKTPKYISKLFGIGGKISYKNLKRNKKKYVTSIISIAVSVSTFIALYSFTNIASLYFEDILNISDYNISVDIGVEDRDEFYNKGLETVNFDNIENYTILRQNGLEINSVKYLNKEPDLENDYIGVLCVGEKSYNDYIKKIGLNYEDVKDKAILMDTTKVRKFDEATGKTTYEVLEEFKYNKGDKLSGTLLGDKNFEIEIASTTKETPFALPNMSGKYLIVSDELYNSKLVNEDRNVYIYYKSNNPNKLQDDIEDYLKEYGTYVNNISESVELRNNAFILIEIFLYGFIIVISLIGITNIFNTITTNMELRRQEFAMLKSIGMTKKEFNRMIRLESTFIGLKSLFFGLPIGIALSYLIYHYLAEDSGIRYSFPFVGVIISIVIVFLLITLLMKYSMNKINKQNIIETIRNENI